MSKILDTRRLIRVVHPVELEVPIYLGAGQREKCAIDRKQTALRTPETATVAYVVIEARNESTIVNWACSNKAGSSSSLDDSFNWVLADLWNTIRARFGRRRWQKRPEFANLL
jgi:hypothetical protein